MNQKTIKQLNQLNREFYQQTAEHFSQSRSYYWSGWEKLLPYINVLVAHDKQLDVVDLGCGNGRFGQFLDERIKDFPVNYLGLDFNQSMLAKAEKKLVSTNVNYQLNQVDLLNDPGFAQGNFNLITAFGLFHHLPSFQFRQNLIKQLLNHLTAQGLLVITFWQFADKKRFRERVISPEEVGVNPDNLEKNDYVLDWKRGKTAYRYCHHLDEKEMQKVIKSLEADILDHYLADGKSNNLNRYLILR